MIDRDNFDITRSLENRIQFYVDQLPELEAMSRKMFEKCSEDLLDDSGMAPREALSLYVRLFEVHERIYSLIMSLVKTSKAGMAVISEDESTMLGYFRTLSDEKKETIINDIKLKA